MFVPTRNAGGFATITGTERCTRSATHANLRRFVSMPSAVIRHFSYDQSRRRLDIRFVSGECYSYFDVPETVVSGLAGARSKGRYFQHHIRDKFDYHREWQA